MFKSAPRLAAAFLLAASTSPALASSDDTSEIERERAELEQRQLELQREQAEIARRKLELEARENPRETAEVVLPADHVFIEGSARMQPGSEATLRSVAELVGGMDADRIRIEAHTDSDGQPAELQELSTAQAMALRDWLVLSAGLPAEKIEFVGYGDTRPRALNDNPKAGQLNRRMEISVTHFQPTAADMEIARFEVGAPEADETVKVALEGDLLFPFGKTVLQPEAEDALNRLALVIDAFPDSHITVVGHTDSVGSQEVNLELSTERAQAVAQWLSLNTSVPASAIQVIGKGESEPVAPNIKRDGTDNPEGRARNRRVELILVRS